MLALAWGLFLLGLDEEKTEKAENKLLEASISPRLSANPEIFPIRNWKINEPEINAQSAIVMSFGSDDEKGNILFKTNIDQFLPIASLTKIMTAIIALENFDTEEVIKVSKNSVLTLGDKGGLIRGEELKVKDLLYIMLMESSNDAAMALIEGQFFLCLYLLFS